jgi:ribonuclease HII
MRSRPDLLFEQHFRQQGIVSVAGVDEAGVGAWAGPVVAVAVILRGTFHWPA